MSNVWTTLTCAHSTPWPPSVHHRSHHFAAAAVHTQLVNSIFNRFASWEFRNFTLDEIERRFSWWRKKVKSKLKPSWKSLHPYYDRLIHSSGRSCPEIWCKIDFLQHCTRLPLSFSRPTRRHPRDVIELHKISIINTPRVGRYWLQYWSK